MKLLILGVGNPLKGDDGFGVAAVQELMREPLPEGVAAVDGGTAGLGLASLIEEGEAVLILDAADMGKPAGTVREFAPHEVRSLASEGRLSLHEADVLGILRMLTELGTCPAVSIIAVQPGRIGYGMGLSAEVQAALPVVLQRVREAMARLA